MPEPLVSVGLVTWNSAACLESCLAALACQNYPRIELVVVDNASEDNSVELITRSRLGAAMIKNAGNTGFCHAHNQGIQASTGVYYLALNPDIEMRPDYIARLVAALETDHSYGTAVGKLLLLPGEKGGYRLDSAGLFLDRRRRQFLRGHREMDHGQYDISCEVFGADGAAPLYRREMLEDIKIQGQYFDEMFFAHKEDVDLAWRARLRGWRCRYESSAIAFHSRTFRPGRRDRVSSEIRLHAVKNRYYLLIKNETSTSWRRDWPPILWYDLKILIYLLLFERSSLQAFVLLRRDWARLKSWRQEIMTKVRVSSGDILKWFQWDVDS